MPRYSVSMQPLSPEQFSALAVICKKVTETLGLPLAGWDGTGEPIFSDSEIVFNGRGEAQGDTFCISRTGSFGIMQTYGHDYDLAVRCCLLVFKQALGDDIVIISTVPEDALDWIEANSLVLACGSP